MFEITPSPEFSAWFEALSEPLAEEVTTQLELVASAASLLSPAHVSKALLWFDGTGNGSPWALDFFARARLPSQRSLDAFEHVRELLLWRQEIARCLASDLFRERLAELEPKAAALALTEVERVRALLDSARAQTTLEAGTITFPTKGPVSAHEMEMLRARFGSPASPLKDELSRAFRRALELVGLEPGRVIDAESGLRELTLAHTSPKLHVLFALDGPGRRLLALLGEPLDRRYYGDSVRLAERRWAEYCERARAAADGPEP